MTRAGMIWADMMPARMKKGATDAAPPSIR